MSLLLLFINAPDNILFSYWVDAREARRSLLFSMNAKAQTYKSVDVFNFYPACNQILLSVIPNPMSLW